MQKKQSRRFALLHSTLLLGSLWIGGINLSAQAQGVSVEQIRALIEKGNYLMNRQQFQPAVETYQEVLDLEPNNVYARTNIVLAHNNWGIYHFHKGEYALAKAEWDKALTIDPNDRNAKNNLVVLNRTLTKLGKSLDEPAKKTPAGAEEKKKDEAPAPPPAVVLLTPQKKQDATTNPQPPAGDGKATSYTEQDVKAPEAASIVAPSSPPPPPAIVPEPTPVKRTKADDELDAFRRMTSPNTPSSSYGSGNQNTASPPGISSFRPVPRRNVGSPSSFFDDTGAPPARPAPVESEQQRPQSAPEQEAAPPSAPAAYSSTGENPSDEQKPAHKKKHPRPQVADTTNPGWTGESAAPIANNGAGLGNVDSSLNKLETKIYGQPRPQPSVFKRLERMEIDSFGSAGVGSITDRIAKLKKMYNVTD